MPNGRPGDHPLTDMLHHRMPTSFPNDIFEAVLALSERPRFAEVRERLAWLLWDNWPRWSNVSPDLALVRHELEQLSAELDAAA